METTQTSGRVLDVVSAEQTSTPGNAAIFRRHRGGSLASTPPYVSRLGGASAFTAATGIGAFGEFLKGLLSRKARYRRAETPAGRRA